MDEIKTKTQSSDIFVWFEKISFGIMIALTLLLPIFFIPSVNFPFQYGKSFLYGFAILLAFGFWVVGRLKDGTVVLPKNLLLTVAGTLPLFFLISSILSPNVFSSLLGDGFEVGTFSFILISIVGLFLTSTLFNSKTRVFYFYAALFVSTAIAALFHLIRFFGGADVLSFGLLTDITANLVGKWNDLAVFFGLTSVLSLVALETLQLTKRLKIFVSVSLGLSLFLLAVVNFYVLWIVLAIFSFVFFLYQLVLSRNKAAATATEGARASTQIPLVSLSVLIISVIFILANGPLGGMLSNYFQIYQVEARPSWQATYEISKKVLAKDPVFGVGPNRFVNEWLAYKPDSINATVFWNTDFNYAIGIIPTFLITTGILGFLAWVAFLGLLVYTGFKAILTPIEDSFSRYLVISSFLGSLYLWLFNVIYIPSTVTFGLAFLFTGIFVAVLYQEKMLNRMSVDILKNPSVGFVSVLLLILLLIGNIAFGYLVVQKSFAAMYFQKGINAFNVQGNLDSAEQNLVKAVNLSGSDSYYRALAEVNLLRMNNVLNRQDVSAEVLRTEFQQVLGTAIENARTAVNINGTDYKNWVSLGRVYEAVLPLKIQGAYENAERSYQEALKNNPQSPALYLILARLEATNGNNVKAREYITKALQLKNNYTDAIFFLSQIEVAEGNTDSAIQALEAAVYFSPDDVGLYFQLGLLRYNDKDYAGAMTSLERAVQLNSDYANAKYFLGLSYDKLDRTDDAIKQFVDIERLNPDNQEVKTILKNLRAGRSALSNIPTPDNTPEKRKELPIKEE